MQGDMLKMFQMLGDFLIWPLVIASLPKLLPTSGFWARKIRSFPNKLAKLVKTVLPLIEL